jgi:photosystem II stability/assembly factor-like uncharacterized protein
MTPRSKKAAPTAKKKIAPERWKPITEGNLFLHAGWANGRGEVFLTGQLGRLFRSRDSGTTWERLRPLKKPFFTAVCRAPDGAIYLGDTKGVLQTSRDDGKTWVAVKLPRAGRLNAFLCTADQVYALGSQQLFHWDLGAEDWYVEQPTSSQGSIWHRTLAADPQGRMFIMGGSPSYVLSSDDRGHTWTPHRVSSLLKGALCGTVARKYVYIADRYGLVFRSDDRGKSWVQLKPRLKAKEEMLVQSLWSVGETLLIAYSGVRGTRLILRSDDAGKHFSVDFLIERSVESMETLEAFVGSATGHVVAIGAGHCWRAEIPEAKKLSLAPMIAPQSVAPAKQTRPRTSWDDHLEKLLEIWRATRSPAVADLIDRVAKKVPPEHAGQLHRFGGDTLQLAWLEAVAHARASDLPALCGTVRHGQLSEIEQRLAALERLADDPRVAMCSASWVDAYPFGSTSSKPCWTMAFRLLERCADARTESVVRAARQRGVPISGKSMRAWVEGALDRCLSKLPAAILAAQKPLTAEQQTFCAQVESAL